MVKKVDRKKFVRYKEGAEIYSMGLTKFQELAKQANAIYKVDKLVLVNCNVIKIIVSMTKKRAHLLYTKQIGGLFSYFYGFYHYGLWIFPNSLSCSQCL